MPAIFLNAYNFVPLPNHDCIRESLEKGNLTGKITCTIVPKTDIFVPNTSNETCNYKGTHGKTVREFFSYKQLEDNEDNEDNYEMTNDNAPEHPVIPGSEIRGMVRSMYEAMTDSCLSALDMPDILSSRSNDAKNPGLLHYSSTDGWILIEADKNYLNEEQNSEFHINNPDKLGYFDRDGDGRFLKLTSSDNRHYVNSKLYVNTREEEITRVDQRTHRRIHIEWKYVVNAISDDANCNADEFPSEGYLYIGEDIDNKHYHYIFSDNGQDPIEENQKIITKAIQQYNENIRIYQKNDENMHVGCEIPLKPADGKYFCVWFEKIGNRLYLAPSALSRDVYYNDLTDFTKGYEPCDSDMLCDACRLFGTVSNNSNLGTRIRFSDALFTGNTPEYSPITTLKELSSPKSTCMEMYTKVKGKAANTACWTYDYYKIEKKKFPLTKNEMEINGRKFYYHHPECSSSDYYKYKYTDPDSDPRTLEQTIKDNSERLVTVRALKGSENNTFSFDLYFEHITEDELKKLLLVLSLCGNDNDYCYKLGMGKPIGLGSVKIKVNDVKIRTFKAENICYQFESNSNFKDCYENVTDTSLVAFRTELQNLLNFNYSAKININDGIHYPKITPRNEWDRNKKIKREHEGFRWFVNNRIMGRNASIDQKLNGTGILTRNQDRR